MAADAVYKSMLPDKRSANFFASEPIFPRRDFKLKSPFTVADTQEELPEVLQNILLNKIKTTTSIQTLSEPVFDLKSRNHPKDVFQLPFTSRNNITVGLISANAH
jgi:hypothetical protein